LTADTVNRMDYDHLSQEFLTKFLPL